MILHFGRGFDFAVGSQRRGTWDTDPFYAADAPLVELSASTVGILGLGGIGLAGILGVVLNLILPAAKE
jgi:phosphoglycerate dehydrogenase-like enzyme